MRRQGPGWDNAVAERFFQTLKTACVSLAPCATREQAQEAIVDDMEGFSNRQRRHAANGHLAPVLYEPSQKAA
jgi:putative transposase